MLSWDNFTAFYFFFLVLFVSIYLFFLCKKQKIKFIKEMQHNIFLSLFIQSKKRSKKKKIIFQMIVIFGLILSYAGPQWGYKYKKRKQKITEIILLIDVSTSMLAEDLGVSRLLYVKKEVLKFLDTLEGQRIGLVAFAKDTKIISPLTTDIDSLKLYLKALSTKSVPRQGTEISQALRISQSLFSAVSGADKAIILISDGELHENEIQKEGNLLNKKNLWIFTLGVGGEKAVPIPIKGSEGEPFDYKRNSYGDLVLTQFNSKSLERLSKLANGKYYHLTFLNNAFDEVSKDLSRLKNKSNKLSYQRIYRSLYYYILIFSFIFLFLDIIYYWDFLNRGNKNV